MSTATRAPSNVTRLNPRAPSGSDPVLARITPAQRAAVVVAILGESAAKPIVEKLDDAALMQISAGLETVKYLDREQLVEIVMDFLQNLRQSSGAFRGGPGRARKVVESLIDQSRIDQIFGNAEPVPEVSLDTGSNVWERVQQKPPLQIAEYLDGLTPHIAALILRKLDTAVASDVVTNLSDEKLDKTIGYLVETDQVDPEIENVVGRMVEIEFLNNSEVANEEVGGSDNLEAVGEMLSLISAERRDRLLAFIKTEHEDKLPGIEKVLFTIEALPDMLPRNSVPVVFRELGEEQLLPVLSTLTGSAQPVADYLLSNISSRLADQFRDSLNAPNQKPVADAEATQREFLTALMSLKRRGLIVMEKPPAE